MTDMLMEFESLDATDVKEIMAGTWNAEAKRERLKSAENLQMKMPPPAPSLAAKIEPPTEGMQPV